MVAISQNSRITVSEGVGIVPGPIVRIADLDAKAGRRINPEMVNLIHIHFHRQVIMVVAVRRESPVPGWDKCLTNKQILSVCFLVNNKIGLSGPV